MHSELKSRPQSHNVDKLLTHIAGDFKFLQTDIKLILDHLSILQIKSHEKDQLISNYEKELLNKSAEKKIVEQMMRKKY